MHPRHGIVLPVVLFFTLLLSSSVATFLKRATVDAMLSRNRDAMARTEALARGGVELAKALLIEDRATEALSGDAQRTDSSLDRWAQADGAVITTPGGAELRIHIEDTSSRLNLNAVFQLDDAGQLSDRVEPFLQAFLEKMIEELALDVRGLYDVRELAENLIDYVDPDDTRIDGGLEDDYYQQQVPPYRAANGPLTSVDQLRLVEGFDNDLVEIIRPYITVYPYVGGGGVNPNTAPAHVLALIFYNDGVDLRLAKEDDVGRILDVRANGDLLCNTAGSTETGCVPLGEILPNADSVFPPLALYSDTFIVRSEATAGDIRRTVEAVVDRSTLTAPALLSWRVW